MSVSRKLPAHDEAYFTTSIHQELRNSTRPWLTISKLVLEAKVALRPASSFRNMLISVGLNYSTAQKLLRIEKCKRLKRYADQLACVDGWSTLYAIALLRESEFEEFRKEYLDPQNPKPFCRTDVEVFNTDRQKVCPVPSTDATGSVTLLFAVYEDPHASLSANDRQVILAFAKTAQETLHGKVKFKQNENALRALMAVDAVVVTSAIQSAHNAAPGESGAQNNAT